MTSGEPKTCHVCRTRQIRLERARIVKEIATVACEIGFCDAPDGVHRLAEALDKGGYRTAQGHSWTAQQGTYLRQFLRQYIPGLLRQVQQLKDVDSHSIGAAEDEEQAPGAEFLDKCRECVVTCETISEEMKFLLEESFRDEPELQLYTLDEVAKLLKVTRSTVERLLRAGDLEYQYVLSRKRISKKALEEYYVKHTIRKAKGRPLYARHAEAEAPCRKKSGRPPKFQIGRGQ